MLVRKSLSPRVIFNFAGHHLWWLTAWMLLVTSLYHYANWRFLSIPWLPISVVGTAVAFYVGFKNNQAYDRLWEGRKIWGSIINSSRTWGTMVKAYIDNEQLTPQELKAIKQRLIYRHIGWLYTFREQLLVPTQWEHVQLRWRFGIFNQKRKDAYGSGAFEQDIDRKWMKRYYPFEDHTMDKGFANAATQIMDMQSQDLAQLQKTGSLELRRQLELQNILGAFYQH